MSDLAVASVASAGMALAEWLAPDGSDCPVVVDRRLASLWFGMTLQPQGWTIPPPWDPIAGDYLAGDGWIRLHTNAPHHRAAALAVLGTPADKAAVTAAVSGWIADTLEAEIVAQGGCAAAMRTLDAWAAHPQGRAVAGEPLLGLQSLGAGPGAAGPADPSRPLGGSASWTSRGSSPVRWRPGCWRDLERRSCASIRQDGTSPA